MVYQRKSIRLFPAYAGVIPDSVDRISASAAFPRIRGGDPELAALKNELANFSPHTRG